MVVVHDDDDSSSSRLQHTLSLLDTQAQSLTLTCPQWLLKVTSRHTSGSCQFSENVLFMREVNNTLNLALQQTNKFITTNHTVTQPVQPVLSRFQISLAENLYLSSTAAILLQNWSTLWLFNVVARARDVGSGALTANLCLSLNA